MSVRGCGCIIAVLVDWAWPTNAFSNVIEYANVFTGFVILIRQYGWILYRPRRLKLTNPEAIEFFSSPGESWMSGPGSLAI